MKQTLFTIIVLSIGMNSCNSESGKTRTTYEMISDAFEDAPAQHEIKPLLENVMDKYHYSKTEDHKLGVANMLVELRKSSAVGVTEMEILKHMYQEGDSRNTIDKQAALSATILEISK